MTLYRKVQAVERVFKGLEKDVAAFKRATDLRCVNSCGRCCTKTDIAASTIEFLPLAYHLYKQGTALEWYHKLEENTNPVCQLFSPVYLETLGGMCTQYQYRGLICRLFGFSAKLDKHGVPQIVTCRTIKETFPEAYQSSVNHIAEGKTTPIMRNYYFQLQAIDSNLCTKLLPINEAIKEALKVVLSYYAYRRPRSA
ncbi:MAG TPA: YkgJ family cysteine cluster protein [Mangrovimonas sp.]|nr:YkgJ family cysteine cluster protein [Mangrovimonas sp.]